MAAAGSAQITEEAWDNYKLIKWEWTSGTGETVVADCTTTLYYTGPIKWVVTVPGAGGAAPTDNYDVKILDKNDIDLLDSAGYNRDATSVEVLLGGSLGISVHSQLELNIAAAGSSNTGVVYAFIGG